MQSHHVSMGEEERLMSISLPVISLNTEKISQLPLLVNNNDIIHNHGYNTSYFFMVLAGGLLV